MSFIKISLVIWGSIIAILALFAIPFFLLDLEQFMMVMPFLMAGLFTVVLVIVGVVFYRVFISAGKKKAATIAQGESAEATIVSVQDTGVTLQGGLYFQVEFGLEVRPAAGAAFTATAKDYVSRVSIAQYQPGTTVQVKYNPRNLAEIAIVGLAGAPQSGAVGAGSEPVFASDSGAGGVAAPAPATGRSFSSRKIMAMIFIPLIVSGVFVILPLVAIMKKDAVADFFIEKTIGKYEMRAVSVVDHYTPPEKTIFKPAAGNKWLMVTLTVTNTGGKQMSIAASQMKLITRDGLESTPDIVVDTGNDFDTRSIAAGGSFTGNIVYEVPENATGATIRNIFGDETLLPAAGGTASSDPRMEDFAQEAVERL